MSSSAPLPVAQDRNATIKSPVAVPPPEPCGRVYVPLPKFWIGMVIAVACLAGEALGTSVVMFVSMIGSCYWLFCIHRMHKVLKEYTCCRYPISPRKAVLCQIIPLFGYYWFFRWTRQMARFVENQGGKKMPKLWPGVLLATSSFLGWVPELKGLRLLIIFGVGMYLSRKLGSVLPPAHPMRLKLSQRWNLGMSAGVGAAYSFVLLQAVHNFFEKTGSEKLRDLGVIFLVSVGVLIFLEPAFEHLRVVLGIAQQHPHLNRTSWHLRISALLILMFTGLFHGLLETEFENWLKDPKDLARGLTSLAAALLVTGGITYFWIGGAHRHPSHAARSGLLSGVLLGSLVAAAVLTAYPQNGAGSVPGQTGRGQKLARVSPIDAPFVSSRIIDDVSEGKLGDDQGLQQMAIIALPWPIFGLIGGLVIDKRWPKGKVIGVAASVFVVALLYDLLLLMVKQADFGWRMAPNLAAAFGWGLSLLVCSSSRVLMPEREEDEGGKASPPTNMAVPA